MSVAVEIVDYLDAQGVADKATNLFSDEMPPEPPTCMSVTDYAGREPEYVLGSASPAYEYSRVQIQVRGATKSAGRTLIRAAYNALASVRNQTIDGSYFVKMTPLQQPFRMMKDENRRTIFAFNVEVEKRR